MRSEWKVLFALSGSKDTSVSLKKYTQLAGTSDPKRKQAPSHIFHNISEALLRSRLCGEASFSLLVPFRFLAAFFSWLQPKLQSQQRTFDFFFNSISPLICPAVILRASRSSYKAFELYERNCGSVPLCPHFAFAAGPKLFTNPDSERRPWLLSQ